MPPPLPLPRFRIWRSAWRRCRPATGSLEAIPMTPQPPSASSTREDLAGGASSQRREARIASARASGTGLPRRAVGEDVGAPAQLADAFHSEAAQEIRQLPPEGFVETADPLGAPPGVHESRELRIGRCQSEG